MSFSTPTSTPTPTTSLAPPTIHPSPTTSPSPAPSTVPLSSDSCPDCSSSFAAVHTSVANYYGRVLKHTKDLQTNACCTSTPPTGTMAQAIKLVPTEIINKYYGCGSSVPLGIEGLNVLDLGSGSGRDAYVAAYMVGPTGSVTGIDMTDAQLEVANRHIDAYTKKLGYAKPNLRFVKGYIEFLREAGIEDGSLDLVISNCVVNLSPDKPRVLKAVYDALKVGGEFYFSDVYVDRRLPKDIREHEVLFGECLGGALYVQDFIRICHSVGFMDPRVVSRSPITVENPKLQALLGNAKFTSITYRLFKLPQLETLCEDYGQVAIYKGTIPGHAHFYELDDHHRFITNKPMLVCGNSASMVSDSLALSKHFSIIGDRSVHYGLFHCSSTTSSIKSNDACGAEVAGCC